MSVPELRLRAVNDAPVRPDRAHVLYWMIGARRTTWSFGLDRAVERCRELGRPLVVLEPLRAGHRWASARFHAFVTDGMRANRDRLAGRPWVRYHPYVEPRPGDGRGLLEALARQACVVVTDDVPFFFLPRMVAAAGTKLDVRLEAVDSHGVLPMRLAGKEVQKAHAYRRLLQKGLVAHGLTFPSDDPLKGVRGLPDAPPLPVALLRRWPAAALDDPGLVASLPIDQAVAPVAGVEGGARAGGARLTAFLAALARYGESRDDPDADATSRLSPWLHFGHVAAHEVLARLTAQEAWTPARLAPKAMGQKEGWWGMTPAAEAFVDQVVTWREVGLNACVHLPGTYDTFASVPAWAQRSLARHAGDPREATYGLATLEAAKTGDRLWNAAQRQLLREGRIHNHLRMLWGKKVLEWTPSAADAFDALVTLNDKYALDGRDPNSYSGISWVFGRYDRPWPERAVFGVVRCMTSGSAMKKLRLREYLERYGP